MIAAGIGSRKGVSADEVLAAVDAALAAHGLERGVLGLLATMEIKRGERGIFEAGEVLGLAVVVVDSPQTLAGLIPPPLTPPHKGEGDRYSLSARTFEAAAQAAPESPSPLWGGVRGGGASEDAVPIRKSLSLAASADPRDKPEGDGAVVDVRGGLSLKLAGVSSVSEAAALAAAGEGARLAGPRIAVGRVTCALAFGRDA